MSLPLLTNSRTKAFRRCARLEYYMYQLGYRAIVDAEALRFGDLVHLGLKAWWMALMPEAVRLGLGANLPQLAGTAEEEALRGIYAGDSLYAATAAVSGAADPFDAVKARVLLAGYHSRWGADGELEPLGVEEEFTAPLINPETGAASKTWRLAGKLDVRARERSTGRIVIVEHKTSSEDFSDGTPYRAALKLNNQVSVYFKGAEQLGTPADDCLYDVIGKPSIRPSGVAVVEDGAKVVLDGNGQRVRTKDGKKWRETGDTAFGYVLQTRPETPEEFERRLEEDVASKPEKYFARFRVVRLEDEMAEHAFDLWQTARIMRESQVAGRAPKNDDGCFRFGRPCEFLPVCVREGSLDDASRYVRLTHVHPELAQVASATVPPAQQGDL